MTQAPWPPPSVEQQSKRSLLSIFLLWIGCYSAAVALSIVVTSSSVGGSDGAATDDPTTLVLALSALGLWLPFVFMLRWVARSAGSNLRNYFGLKFAKVDWIGIPLGVFSQVVLMNVVNWPLNKWWPDTFNPERVENRARDMVDAARGVWFIVLFLIITGSNSTPVMSKFCCIKITCGNDGSVIFLGILENLRNASLFLKYFLTNTTLPFNNTFIR